MISDPEPVEQAILDFTGSAMVTRWVVVAETIEEDGQPVIHSFTSPGLPMWARYGMLTWEAAGFVPQPIWSYTKDED